MIDLMKFRHFGLALKKPDSAKFFLEKMGYKLGPDVEDESQKVFVCEADHVEHPRVELIWPATHPSPIDNILKRGDGLIYHTCWETQDVTGVLKSFEEQGIRYQMVSDSTPAPLFSGNPVSFYYVLGFGLIELLETQ